jgi:branched-subunit amino acid ABC-type transport system permease component
VIPWFGGPTAPTIALPLVIMLMLAVGLVGGLGVAIERFACRPLRDAPLTGAHNDLIWAPVVMNAADVVAAQNGGSGA